MENYDVVIEKTVRDLFKSGSLYQIKKYKITKEKDVNKKEEEMKKLIMDKYPLLISSISSLEQISKNLHELQQIREEFGKNVEKLNDIDKDYYHNNDENDNKNDLLFLSNIENENYYKDYNSLMYESEYDNLQGKYFFINIYIYF
jgi:hypothetical protein